MKKLTKEKFIERSKEKHGNKYDYSLVKYNGNRKKVKIICKNHGIFEQIASSHMNGYGCLKCNMNNKKFIEKANKIHNNKYDYSLVEYYGFHKKINIICPEHDVFEQIAGNHLKGYGCIKCKIITNEKFIEKANKIHNNKYDYSLVEYKNNYTKINIICLKHGLFKQSPNSHLSAKQGCPKCYGNKKLTKEKFIERSKEKHGNKYDYSLVNYKNNRTKINIICIKHGKFKQTPYDHLNGKGCSICNESKGEREIRQYFDNKNIKYEYQKIFENCKYKSQLKFDFYLLKYNMCIEYDGIQHFKPIDYFGGIKTLKKQIKKDNIKNNFCKKNNIHLIRIKYNENIIEKLTNLLIC